MAINHQLSHALQIIGHTRGIWADETIGKITLKNIHLAKRLTLAHFKAARNTQLHDALIQDLTLEKSIACAEQIFSFFERLYATADEVLSTVSLYSLQKVQVSGVKNSEIADALVDEETFLNTSLFELKNRTNLKVLQVRLNQATKGNSSGPFSIGKIHTLGVEKILNLKLSLPCFSLLSEAQIQSMDFKKLSPEQVMQCIKGAFQDEASIRKRLKSLNHEQLCIAIQVGTSDVLQYIEAEQVEKAGPQFLTQTNLDFIFCNWRFEEEKMEKKIAALSEKWIQRFIPIVSDAFLSRLSLSQIRSLELQTVRPEKIEAILLYPRLSEQKKREKINALSTVTLCWLIAEKAFEVVKYIHVQRLLEINLQTVSKEVLAEFFPPLDEHRLMKGTFSRTAEGHCMWTGDEGVIYLKPQGVQFHIQQRQEMCFHNYQVLKEKYESFKHNLGADVRAFLAKKVPSP